MKNRIQTANAVRLGILSTGLVSSIALAGGTTSGFIRVDGYRDGLESPFVSNTLILNNFELGAESEGLSITGPAIVGAGNSVDGDDQSLDGSGSLGKSLSLGSWLPPFAPGSATFAFSPKVLGGSPTEVGVVITNANGLEDINGNIIPVTITVTVSFADGSMASSSFPVLSQDGNATDDTFIGFASALDVLSMSVQAEIPIGVDHVQYALPAQLVPPSVRNDFNGDGKSDICWINGDSSRAALWTMDGLTRTANGPTSATPVAGAMVVGSGDLNADQRADLVWLNPATGVYSAWLMDGATVLEQGAISGAINAAWKFLGAGDIDGNGTADCVFRHETSGMVHAWIMDGLVRSSAGTIGDASGLSFLGMGDIDGDGKSDLLWRNNLNRIEGWKIDGLTIASQGQIANSNTINPEWAVSGLADLDANGTSDIVWRNEASGAVHGWLLNGLTRVADGRISNNVGTDWSIVGTPDLDGDGKDDLLWRNSTSGDVHGWFMNGLTKDSGGFIRNALLSWSPIK